MCWIRRRCCVIGMGRRLEEREIEGCVVQVGANEKRRWVLFMGKERTVEESLLYLCSILYSFKLTELRTSNVFSAWCWC
jgi:hypothetical protein